MRAGPLGLVLGAALVLPLAACSAPPPSAPGPALVRLSMPSHRCPSRAGGADDVLPSTTDRTTLLPDPSQVSGALVCEFASTIGPRSRVRGRLLHEVVLAGADARRLGAAVHAVDIVDSTGGVSCPSDSGTATVIAFRRSGGARDIDLWWWTSGCQSLDDGTLRTVQVANPSFWRFQQRFASVVRTPH